jgi:hypothetical protein
VTRRLAALAAVAFLAVGCGAAKDATDATQLVPADALAYVQLRGAVPPPSAFPHAPKEYAHLVGRLPRLRRPVDVALLPEGWVAFRAEKIKDAPRIRGFTVVAQNTAALDAVRHAKQTLADSPRYGAASKTLGDAPFTAYLRSGKSLEVTADTVALHWRGPRRPTLGDVAIAKGAVAAIGLAADASPPASTLRTLTKISHSLGVDVVALLHALDGPAYASLVPGEPIPTLTIVATPRHPQRAKKDVGRLLERVGRVTASPSPSLTTVDLGPVAILFGLAGSRLIISNDEASAEQSAPTASIPGLPATATRFAWMHGATPTMAALAPGLGIAPPKLRADFLLYESFENGVWSRVERIG